MASSAKQSKPLPKVLSSISFHISSSHRGGAVLVKFMLVISVSLISRHRCGGSGARSSLSM
jgi:hypothetical protein